MAINFLSWERELVEMAPSQLHFHPEMSLTSTSACLQTLPCSCPSTTLIQQSASTPAIPTMSWTFLWNVTMFVLPLKNTPVGCIVPWYSYKKGKNMFIKNIHMLERRCFNPKCFTAASIMSHCRPAHYQLSTLTISFPKVTCRKLKNRNVISTPNLTIQSYSCSLLLPLPVLYCPICNDIHASYHLPPPNENQQKSQLV